VHLPAWEIPPARFKSAVVSKLDFQRREKRIVALIRSACQAGAGLRDGSGGSRPPLALIIWMVAFVCPTLAAEPLVKFELPGRTLEGTPLVSAQQKAFLLARDGQCVEFSPSEATSVSQVAGGFKSYSQAEIRGNLLREFGKGFEVSGVGHYLVVHPAGKRDQWAPRFEELYRSFLHYFAARSWQLTEPRFPLVAVVYPREADFWKQANREGMPRTPGVLGYYSPLTNRILMFDSALSGYDWTQNAETIIHEAAHQTAYNTGVHGRFGDNPRWIVEGLGTMFEARGVWQSRAYPRQSDRLNRGRLQAFRAYAAGRRPADAIAQIVASDRLFSSDPDGAYAEAWALSFFLVESEPQKYQQLLTKTAALPAFADYPAPRRLRDFTEVFGSDLKMLDARMQRFIAGLK
jgi:uncharacterized protein DUF1570